MEGGYVDGTMSGLAATYNLVEEGRTGEGACPETRAGRQTRKIVQLQRENALLSKENKQLKARLAQFEQDKVKWEVASREQIGRASCRERV